MRENITKGNAKEQVGQDLIHLHHYLIDTLCEARDFVAACLDGDDCPAFRDLAKSYLLDAAKTLRSRQITGIIPSLVAEAIGAISAGALYEANEVIGQALSILWETDVI